MDQGDFVAPNVRLARMLSAGGMGSVWVADHLTLNTKVAVKFMSEEMAEHPEALSRFKREASASARVKSPHIVQVFDHGVTSNGVPYIVMELLHGEDLHARLERGPLSLRDTLEVTRQVLKALGGAHREGIIHRDIKPSNVFLLDIDGDLFVKVLDFGIAKQTASEGPATHMTRSGALLGTPHYMSPEQMLGSLAIDARSDLWAVGVLAYRALTGVPPFDGETIGALSVAINAAQFVAPSALVPALPAEVDAWFSRALARAPEARFSAAREMADALTEAVPRDQRSRRPPGPDSSATSAARVAGPASEPSASELGAANTLVVVTDPNGTIEPHRPRLPAALAITGLMVLAIGGSLFFYSTRHAQSAPASASAGQDVVAPAVPGRATTTSGASPDPSSSSASTTSAPPLVPEPAAPATVTDTAPGGKDSAHGGGTVAITNAGRPAHARPSASGDTAPPPSVAPRPVVAPATAPKDRGF